MTDAFLTQWAGYGLRPVQTCITRKARAVNNLGLNTSSRHLAHFHFLSKAVIEAPSMRTEAVTFLQRLGPAGISVGGIG